MDYFMVAYLADHNAGLSELLIVLIAALFIWAYCTYWPL